MKVLLNCFACYKQFDCPKKVITVLSYHYIFMTWDKVTRTIPTPWPARGASDISDFEHTWWRLFQKSVAHTKLDVNVFITLQFESLTELRYNNPSMFLVWFQRYLLYFLFKVNTLHIPKCNSFAFNSNIYGGTFQYIYQLWSRFKLVLFHHRS